MFLRYFFDFLGKRSFTKVLVRQYPVGKWTERWRTFGWLFCVWVKLGVTGQGVVVGVTPKKL